MEFSLCLSSLDNELHALMEIYSFHFVLIQKLIKIGPLKYSSITYSLCGLNFKIYALKYLQIIILHFHHLYK